MSKNAKDDTSETVWALLIKNVLDIKGNTLSEFAFASIFF